MSRDTIESVACAIRKVRSAWQTSMYTPGIERALQEGAEHEEARELASLLRGTTWDMVPEGVLLAECPSPWILGSHAFCYYLPALLIATLKYPDDMAPRLLGSLEAPKKPRAHSRFLRRFSVLSQEQVQAVACVLNCLPALVSEDDRDRVSIRVRRALERFWGQETDGAGVT